MWDGFNKRKFPRLNLHCEILIQSEDSKIPIHANTENLGIGGLCVILDSPLERFSQCRIKLDLKEFSVETAAKVVWIVPTRELKSSKKRYDIGIEFLEISAEDTAKIKQYIKDCAASV